MTVWLTLGELAQYTKKGRSTLYRMAREGNIPAHKFGRNWRFDRDEIDRWLKSGGLMPSPRNQGDKERAE